MSSPYPVRLPYRLDYLPEGLVPAAVGQYTARPGSFGSVIALEDLTADPAAPPTVDIAVGEEFPNDAPDWDPQPTTIAGRPAERDIVDGRRCTIEFEEFTVDIGFANVGDDELARIVAGLHPATWDDPASWFEIDDALPGQ